MLNSNSRQSSSFRMQRYKIDVPDNESKMTNRFSPKNDKTQPGNEFFSVESLNDRLKTYAQKSGLPAEFADAYFQDSKR